MIDVTLSILETIREKRDLRKEKKMQCLTMFNNTSKECPSSSEKGQATTHKPTGFLLKEVPDTK